MSLSHAMDRWPARVTSGKLVLNDAGACGIGVCATAGAVASTVPSAPIVNGVRTFAPIANDFAGCHIAPKRRRVREPRHLEPVPRVAALELLVGAQGRTEI